MPLSLPLLNDKEPLWFNKKIKTLIQEKNAALKNYCNNSSNIDLKCRLKYLQACLDASIEAAKEKYYNTVNKLINTQKKYKVYWSLLKLFLNNKKIPIIHHCLRKSFHN